MQYDFSMELYCDEALRNLKAIADVALFSATGLFLLDPPASDKHGNALCLLVIHNSTGLYQTMDNYPKLMSIRPNVYNFARPMLKDDNQPI